MSTELTITDPTAQGAGMYRLAGQLFPLHRCITGEGVRQSLDLIERVIPLRRIEVPSGTEVFDWTVPQEWSIRDAYIASQTGERIVDYRDSNLHVVNGSTSVDATMDWSDLQSHVQYLPDQPDLVPYRTAYFRDTWGFCVDANQYQRLQSGGPWRVVMDTEYIDGSLSIAECEIEGESRDTILFYCHCCHPSLANDNLSGMVVATYLASLLKDQSLRYTYRLVFAPATIGAISWLASVEGEALSTIRGGLVLTLLGDKAPFTYKRSHRSDSVINRLMREVLARSGNSYQERPFTPDGYDERQFATPGIDLPIGRLSRSNHAEFPEYHTSGDNLELVQPDNLAQSLQVCLDLVNAIEGEDLSSPVDTLRRRSRAEESRSERGLFVVNRFPYGEPQLGRRGLFRAFGEHDDRGQLQAAMMWVLHFADGSHDLTEIAELSGMSVAEIARASELLLQHDLLEQYDQPKPNAIE